MTPAPAPTSDRDDKAPAWGAWLAWTWVGLLLLCAVAVGLAWDDLALALDIVRDMR